MMLLNLLFSCQSTLLHLSFRLVLCELFSEDRNNNFVGLLSQTREIFFSDDENKPSSFVPSLRMAFSMEIFAFCLEALVINRAARLLLFYMSKGLISLPSTCHLVLFTFDGIFVVYIIKIIISKTQTSIRLRSYKH